MRRRHAHALFGRGRVSFVDDSKTVQLVQVSEGPPEEGAVPSILDNVPRLAEFGLASAPPLTSDVVTVRFGGDRAAAVVVATNHQPSRPTGLAPGDTVLYDVRGRRISLTADGIIVDAAGATVTVRNASAITLDAPTVYVTGDLTVAGKITGDGMPVELGALRDAFNGHHHPGVKAGTDTSGISDRTV